MSGPIFILGPMGSGTTLLRLMLDSHRNIAIPQETGFMRVYDAHRFTPFKHSGRGWMQRLGWSEQELDELMREHFEMAFMRYARRHGKQRWGEKTPLHTWHIEDMAALFPNAQFVMIMRHAGGSIASNHRRFKRFTEVERARWHWSAYARRIAYVSSRLGDRMVLLRYEDLVLEPEPVMRDLLEWLGEPWDDAVLQHHTVQVQRGGNPQVEGKSRADQPIDVSRIDGWTRQMPADQREWLASKVRGLSKFYGYDPRDAAVLERLGPGPSKLVTGTQLAARVENFPRLHLDVPITTPPGDDLLDPRKYAVVVKKKLRALERQAAGAERRAAPGRRSPARQVAVAALRSLPPGPRRRVVAAVQRVRR